MRVSMCARTSVSTTVSLLQQDARFGQMRAPRMARRRQRAYTRCIFLPHSHRENIPAGVRVVDVSSYADPPWCQLSPLWAHGGIPVPGMRGVTSDSVEGVWQGLKVI